MTAAALGRNLATAAPAVSVRLTRGPDDCDTEPGARWYLTVRPAEDLLTLRGAAHNRHAIRRPAAPSRRHHQ